MKVFTSIIMFATSLSLSSQVLYPESALLDYYRLLEIKNQPLENRLNLFPSIISPYKTDSLIWNPWGLNKPDNKKKIDLLPLQWVNHYNSKYARGYNDGAVWKGKGLTSSLQGGVQGKLGMLAYTLAPIIYYSQNANFKLAEQQGNNNPYNYQFRNRRIDHVQRYGVDPFMKFDPGQSEVRIVYRTFTLGASTQNITFGPAQYNPIILSNNAAGIPHIDIGTYKPIETKIGRIEGKVYYGILTKSDYFSESDKWNYRFWSGFSIGYNPRFLPELTLGFNRAFYEKSSDFSPIDLLVFINKFDDTDGNPSVNDEFDQLGSVTMRWLFEEVGFEAYAEYAKNDFGGKLWGTAPEHGRAYVVGFNKYVDVKENNVLKLTFEHTSLDQPKNAIYRPYNSWYSHGIVNQGYTLDGQLLGGGIGSGSVTDVIEVQYLFTKGRLMLRAQRIRFDDDYFFDNVRDEFNHDHEWTLGSKYSKFVGAYLFGFDFATSFRQNQYFVKENDKTNIYLGFSITKFFSAN
ncbi:capsule assembly Wzi family protein [Ekhidna sp.]|uniref:capsule assembly Wzi family protein n=1 Tax=Ekhidna sp. TaxID=2608089 RepID=UPI003B5CF2B6